MNKRNIFELRGYVLNKIMNFCEYYKNENILETSFTDWNARDVIGHINSWIKFSEDKLESIKTKRLFNDISHVDIEKFNRMNYEENKYKKLEGVLNESRIILEKYENVLEIFNEDELLSDTFPTGFSFSLWKYMAMDLGIHPLMHILHYYIKSGDYEEFIMEIENSKKYFMEYSENNINEYNFSGLFENKEALEKRFNELKKKNKKKKMVEEIIKINIG